MFFLSMWSKSKSQYKNDLMNYHRGVDHSPLKKKPEEHGTLGDLLDENRKNILENNKDTPAYALNFHSHIFWQISVQELRTSMKPKDIQLFFMDLEKAKDVVMTVKDEHDTRFQYINDAQYIINVPDFQIDPKTFLILEFNTYERKIPARLFRSLLPKGVTQPYVQKYSDHYQRLVQLLLDKNKEILLDVY